MGMSHLCAIVLRGLAVAGAGLCAEADPRHSLREAAGERFAIGVGVSDRIPERPEDWPLLTTQFNSVTPENCLKPDPVQAAEGQFNFSRADAFVDFAASNRLDVVGHCLVWAKDDRTPPWFFRDGTNTAGREVLLRRMKTHIETVAGRYRGRIAMWDVVNEALDDGANFLRPSGWSAAQGSGGMGLDQSILVLDQPEAEACWLHVMAVPQVSGPVVNTAQPSPV